MSALLEIEGLSTHIRVRRGEVVALDRLDLELERGETLGLIGESGCGKTMIALSIMQLLPKGAFVAHGSIRLEGQELLGLPESRMRAIRGAEIGVIFQDATAALNPTMTVGDQIAEGIAAHHRLSRREAIGRACAALEAVGVSDPRRISGAYPHQLSGGTRQRVLISLATACEPRLLVADEPTSALDPALAEQVMGVLQAVKQRMGLSLLVLTHDPAVVAGWADRVVCMRAGRVVPSDLGTEARGADPIPTNHRLPPSAWGLS